MKVSLLKNREFLVLWVGQAISIFGDYVFTTTLVLWISTGIAKGQSWAPLAVSGLFFAESLPILLVGPIAGVFADRWKKRSTMLRMDLFRTIIIASLIAMYFLWQHVFLQQATVILLVCIYLCVILASVCAQFFNPSRMALLSDIVAEEDRPRSMGMMQTSGNMAIVFGPPIGALLFVVLGASWSILLDAISFLVSFCCIFTIRVTEASERSKAQRGKLGDEFRAGIAYYFHNRVLVILLVTGVIFMSGGSALNALCVFFVTDNLHLSEAFYSTLMSASGIGAIAGSIVGSILAKHANLSRILSFSLIGWGVLVLAFVHLTSFAPVLIIFFLLGGLNAGVNIAVGPLLLKNTPSKLVGRAFSVLMSLVTASSMLSTMVAGTLASTLLKKLNAHLIGIQFGPIDTIFTATGILAALAGIYALLSFHHTQQEEQIREEEQIATGQTQAS